MLDNPIWHSLSTRQATVAQTRGCAKRYPPTISPGVAVPDVSAQSAADLRALVQIGERVALLGVVPEMERGWSSAYRIGCYQYVWPAGKEVEAQPQAEKLSDVHIPAMIELTTLVYPAYFRPETARLGDYYGILRDGQLCAMAGIRMSMNGYQELSAICTHPEYRGRGYASLLTRHLIHQVQEQGDTAFLHTEDHNKPAQAVYEKLGFELRTILTLQVSERQ